MEQAIPGVSDSGSLVVAIFLHIPSMFGIGRYTYRPGFSQCAVDCDGDRTCYGIYVAIFSSQMVIGMLLPVILYSILFYMYVKRRQIMGAQENEQGNRQSQSRSLSWSRQDTQILVSYPLIFVTLVVTNIPIFVVTILRRSSPETYAGLPLWAHMLVVDSFYFSSILIPLLIMRNKDFKKALKRLVRRKNKLRQLQNTSISMLHRTSIVRQPPTNAGTTPDNTSSDDETTQQINEETKGFGISNNINQVEQVELQTNDSDNTTVQNDNHNTSSNHGMIESSIHAIHNDSY